MSNERNARQAIGELAAARRSRDVEVPPEREELAAAYLVELWQLADRWQLPAGHFGRTGHMPDAALDIALAPRDEETRAVRRQRRAVRRAAQGGGTARQRQTANRAAWASGERWEARHGERRPDAERPRRRLRLPR